MEINSPHIVLIVGPSGAGKSTAAEFIANALNAPRFSLSDQLREEAKKRGEENPTRQVLQAIGNELRACEGAGTLAERLRNNLTQAAGPIINGGLIIVESVRNPVELETLKAWDKSVKVLGITAPQEIRYQRLWARSGHDLAFTDERFRENEKGDNTALGGTGISSELLLTMADNVINNTGDLFEFLSMLNNATETFRTNL